MPFKAEAMELNNINNKDTKHIRKDDYKKFKDKRYQLTLGLQLFR